MHHLKQTLPQNLKDNIDYPWLEFIILDYGSKDGLKEWITTTMAGDIATGRVVYIQSPGHEYFHRSHSRNLAFSAAKGKIVCNVDADNFTGKDFAKYINEQFLFDEKIFLTAFSAEQPNSPDLFGRICCKKNDFKKVGGYNEKMDGYGFEDHELIQKLSKTGLKREVMTELHFFGAITHSDDERIREEKAFLLLKNMYLSFVSPSRSHILYVFKDGTYARGCIIDRTTHHCGFPEHVLHPKTFRYEHALTTPKWHMGTWEENENILKLYNNAGKINAYTLINDQLTDHDNRFEKVRDKKLITDLLMFYTQFNNRHFLNDDTGYTIRPPFSLKNDSHSVIASSFYWPGNEWPILLKDILQPALKSLVEENNNAFGILRLSKYRGANICITWLLPCHRAEALLLLSIIKSCRLSNRYLHPNGPRLFAHTAPSLILRPGKSLMVCIISRPLVLRNYASPLLYFYPNSLLTSSWVYYLRSLLILTQPLHLLFISTSLPFNV